jgi:hypothetical protein
MVVPVTREGYALPVGMASEILIDSSVATYARVTGSFDLALSSSTAATTFAGDPATAAAVAFSLASIAGIPLESVSVSLFVHADIATKVVNTGNQGGRRLQRLMGLVRIDFGIFFLEHDNTWSTGTANRYPQAFVFMREMQENGASATLARLVEQRLETVSGGVNKYGPLQIERMGPCKIEEEAPTPHMTSSPMPAMAAQHVDDGPWWCRKCRRDPTMQMTVASSGAVGTALFLSCIMALLLCCCKPCRRRHVNNGNAQGECGADAQSECSTCEQWEYRDNRGPDVSFARTVEFHYYPEVSEEGHAI